MLHRPILDIKSIEDFVWKKQKGTMEKSDVDLETFLPCRWIYCLKELESQFGVVVEVLF